MSKEGLNLCGFVILWFRENLSKDLYLMSQMDSDQFVPIWTIASMEGIKVLTTDMDLILDVLRCKLSFKDGVSLNILSVICLESKYHEFPLSLAYGTSGWKRGESASKSQAVHYHPQRGPWNHTCWGEANLCIYCAINTAYLWKH